MSVLELMAAPFVECLILVGIHSYLGLHVIRRRIIFVDLALAQVAALGATVGFLFGIQSGSTGCFLFSLTFCLLGAGLFSLTRMRSERVPQEAVIGLVYAIVAALSVLVIHKTKGADHLEDLLVGSLLWVRWSDVLTAGVAYAAIGALHYIFRKQFLLISDDPEEAYRRGMSVRLWDFAFYATFGFVITFSVRVAGVLLVFVFLVAPAILAVMISQRFRNQLLVGWISGTAVTVAGLYASYVLDLPSGPTVVSFYGVVLLGAAVVLGILRSPRPRSALVTAAAGAVVVLALGCGLVLEGRLLALFDGHGAHGAAHAAAAADSLPAGDPRQGGGEGEGFDEHGGAAIAVTAEPADLAGRTAAGSADSAADSPQGPPGSTGGGGCELDPDTTLEAARSLIAKRLPGARSLLLALLSAAETPPFYREEALGLVRQLAGQTFGYKPGAEPRANRAAVDALCAWAQGEQGSGALLR